MRWWTAEQLWRLQMSRAPCMRRLALLTHMTQLQRQVTLWNSYLMTTCSPLQLLRCCSLMLEQAPLLVTLSSLFEVTLIVPRPLTLMVPLYEVILIVPQGHRH